MTVQRRDMRRLLLLFVIMLANSVFAGAAERSVIYHIIDESQAIRAMNNAKNHLVADPDVHITFVVQSGGMHFLQADASDEKGRAYGPYIDELSMAGVEFKACGNTMMTMNLTLDDLNFGVERVESGMVEVTRLQLEEGYAYVHP
ncbi:MAG TPA: DsrE family protein [Pseudomonadales bacterium]|nr:DsrE family protein [Pseudomonadales bacterium]